MTGSGIRGDFGKKFEQTQKMMKRVTKLGQKGLMRAGLPGMGGVALAQELRRRAPQVPVVLTSGYSHVLAQSDAHDFTLLHKPYSAEQLSRILHQALGLGRTAGASADPS